MKKIFLFCFVFSFTLMFSQSTTRIRFNYDDEGNQIERIICVGCNARTAKDSTITSENITESDMEKDLLYHQISYYPNPVKEELYIKWVNDGDNYVLSLELFSQTGQSITKYVNLKGKETATVPFLNYPSGFYNIVLLYNNGEKKTLKIVKK